MSAPNLNPILGIKTISLTEEEKNLIKKYRPNIILDIRNIHYNSIVYSQDVIEYTSIHEDLKDLTQLIKTLSPTSIIFVELEGGIVQTVKPPITPSFYPSSLEFAVFFNFLCDYYESQNPDQILRSVLEDKKNEFYKELSKFFRVVFNKSMMEEVNKKFLEEKDAYTRARKFVAYTIQSSFANMARSLKEYGIDVIIGSVANLFDGNGGIVQSRSYNNKKIVAEFCIAALKGVKEGGLKNCLRYFICLGGARDDTDRANRANTKQLYYDNSLDEIMLSEGLIFKSIFENYQDIDYLMTADVTLTSVKEDSETPVTLLLSPKSLSKLLNLVKMPETTIILTPDLMEDVFCVKHAKGNDAKMRMIKKINIELSKVGSPYCLMTCTDITQFDALHGFRTLILNQSQESSEQREEKNLDVSEIQSFNF